MVIRPVDSSDISVLSDLVKTNIEHIHPNTFSEDETRVWINDYSEDKLRKKLSEQHLFCLEYGGAILGMVGLKGNEVVGLYIHPKATGKGLGRMLLDYIESFARTEGLKKLVLTSNFPTAPFYEYMGYTATGSTNVVVEGRTYHEMGFAKELF
ncbi:MAG: GNAT family N-acetyltransferase [Saprospiraceae bacterium]|nr:GNAT family N-acetyltransferase [Saprospiraceae bacterium]